jgi:hypothetical protein
MQPLEAIHPAGFAVPAVVGLLVAVGWVAGALWVERDAHAVFGRSRPWKTRILALGPLLLAGACLAGRSFVPAAAALVAVCMAAYVVARDLAAPPDRRLVQVPWLIDGIARVVRTIGLDRWLERLRGPGAAPFVAADRSVILLKKDGSEYSGSEGGTDREIAAAIRTTQRILGEGIAARATDIHFEPKSSQECQLRYRVDGMLRTHRTLSGAEGRAVVSALKVLADMDIAERRRPQDGTFAVLAAERRFDVRAASGPTNFGEKMALRLLDAEGGLVKRGLKGLGMRDSMATTLARHARRHGPDGLRQDHERLRLPRRDRRAHPQRGDDRGSGGVSPGEHLPDRRQQRGRPHVRQDPALGPAAGPRRDPRRRDPRSGDG